MSSWLWLGLLLFILPFGVVPLLGAPYVPTKREKLIRVLKKLKVTRKQRLLDLGSGDGSVVKIAVTEFDMYAWGVELNPFLVAFSRVRLWRYRDNAEIRYGNLWGHPLPPADIIYVFQVPKFMSRLEEKIQQEITKKTTVITYAFSFDGRTPLLKQDGFLAYEFKPLAKS